LESLFQFPEASELFRREYGCKESDEVAVENEDPAQGVKTFGN
jgi:hypothetical protein